MTAVTENTVSLKWNPSTDNSGKFSYQVKVNSLNSSVLETVSQTQTTYKVQYLAPFSSYSFAVYVQIKDGVSATPELRPLIWRDHEGL